METDLDDGEPPTSAAACSMHMATKWEFAREGGRKDDGLLELCKVADGLLPPLLVCKASKKLHPCANTVMPFYPSHVILGV